MQRRIVASAVVVVLLGAGAPVEAQGVASSFEQLAVLVKPGDKVAVVEASGGEVQARVGSVSHDRLSLMTPDGPRVLGARDVALIRQRRDDSVLNGAVIGAVAGTAYFGTMVAVLWDSDGGDVFAPGLIVGGLMFAGMGAAAGAGIDALIKGRKVIYRRPAAGTSVSVSPLLGRCRRGATVTVRF